jgi:hypothetical protein
MSKPSKQTVARESKEDRTRRNEETMAIIANAAHEAGEKSLNKMVARTGAKAMSKKAAVSQKARDKKLTAAEREQAMLESAIQEASKLFDVKPNKVPGMSVSKLFPSLKITPKDDRGTKALEQFVKHHPEYALSGSDDEMEAILTSDDWTACMRFDYDANLDVVFQHSITTYCPREVDAGPYMSTPKAALIAHAVRFKG